MAHAGVRRGPVAVLTSWTRDEHHTIAVGSLLTVCVRDVSAFFHLWGKREHTGPYGMTNRNM